MANRQYAFSRTAAPRRSYWVATMEPCHRHPDRPSSGICMTCRRPYCLDCQIETGYGLFCSMFCAEEAHGHRVQLKRPVGQRKKSIFSLRGLINTLLALLFIGLAIAAIVYFLRDDGGMERTLSRLTRAVLRLLRRTF